MVHQADMGHDLIFQHGLPIPGGARLFFYRSVFADECDSAADEIDTSRVVAQQVNPVLQYLRVGEAIVSMIQFPWARPKARFHAS